MDSGRYTFNLGLYFPVASEAQNHSKSEEGKLIIQLCARPEYAEINITKSI